MKHLKNGFLFLILFIFSQHLSAQSRVNDWQHYTSVLDFTDMVEYNGTIYFASHGGLVIFNPSAKYFSTYASEAGFSRINLESIGSDDKRNFWTGSGEPIGEINIFDPTENRVVKIFDRNTWNEDFTAVTDFVSADGRMFAVCQINTDWGILEFSTDNNYSYKDYYFNFPVNFKEIKNISIAGDYLYVTTTSHLICANYKNSDLKNPGSWELIYESDNISNTILFNDKVLFGVTNDIYTVAGNETAVYIYNVGGNINHLSGNPDNILAATTKGLVEIDNENNFTDISGREFEQAFYFQNKIAGRPENNGFFIYDGQLTQYIPNTSLSNTNTAVCIDDQNRIIAGSTGGFSILCDQGWKNIVRTDEKKHVHSETVDWNYFAADTLHYARVSSRIYSIVQRSDGFLFASVYGASIKNGQEGALVKFDPDDLSSYTLFDTTDGRLATSEGHGGADNYFGIGRMKLDPEENLWICNQYAANNNVIAVLKNDDTWVHFDVQESYNYLDYFPTTFAFDDDGRVWIGDENAGITVLDHNQTLTDKSDDKWYKITTSNGIASNQVFDMAFDQNGTLFLLTAKGIQEIEVNSDFTGGHFFSRYDRNPKFSNLSFTKENMIKIDGQNNKWITTSGSGVLVYTYDNIWLNQYEGYNIENSEVLSNKVLDIDFIESQGLVVMSTNKGISILKSQFSVTRKDYPELKIFPMPFKIPAEKTMVIEGLLPNSEVKILTLDGTFIRKLTPKAGEVFGNQAFWNGRNENGKLVSSGVYICMVYTKEGKNTVGKIAVIRQ